MRIDFLLLASSDREPKRFLQGRIRENPTRFRSETAKGKRSNEDARVEHLVGSWLLREGPVRSSMLFLTLLTSQLEILNRRDVLPWYLHSHNYLVTFIFITNNTPWVRVSRF